VWEALSGEDVMHVVRAQQERFEASGARLAFAQSRQREVSKLARLLELATVTRAPC
jgi:hypothetical protein